MPPKKTRAKKSVKDEVDDLPSLSTFRERRVDPDALFAAVLQSAAVEFGELLNENLQWIFQSKEDLKKICEDFGGSKSVPKTPKRETAFNKIKDTISMFDNLALNQVPQQRIPTPLVFDNAVDEGEFPDEVFEEDERDERVERVVPEREIKTDNSPDVRSKTPSNGREIKEEVLSEGEIEENEEVKPRRGRSRKDARTPTVPHERGSRSTRGARDVEMREDSDDRRALPQSTVHTPSRIRMGMKSPARTGRSPARERDNAAARVHILKKTVSRVGGNDSQSSSTSSPSKTLKNVSKTTGNDMAKRAELMRKLEEKGKTADQNREEAIRERAERARREREEREMKVRAKKEEEEKEREKKRMEIKDRERQVMEMKKRQAQSPVRGGEKERQGTRTPTRMRVKSPEGRLMKRMMNSPLTPRVPVKQHRVHSAKKTGMNWNEGEEEEMEREREAKRIEKERKRRIEEENERIKKIKEEEERVARLKEEERRRAEERERREREKMEKEKREREEREEKERRLREEEEKKMKTPILKNKHLANASMNDSQNSYEMTPDKIYVAATDTNYGVDDLDSGDETDDENNPRKKVPRWASHPQLTRTLALIRHSPPFDPDVFFGPIVEPDLNVIFKPSSKYPKRTSSAMWNSPLSNPTKGKSRFLNH